VRILALSWRYLDHPAAGGAEVVTHEVLKRLAARGHEVVSFTAQYPGGPSEGELDGVRLVRGGGQATVHAQAWRWLRGKTGGFDRVIDQINTIPFLTPLYVPAEKRVFFIHQLAREYWWRETRGALRAVAPLGYAAEPWYLRLYRNTPGITVSESTRADLLRLGIRDVAVAPQALTSEPLEELSPKREPLTAIMVGRLTPAKHVEEGVRAFAGIRERIPDARLDIVGGGDDAYRNRLQALVARDRIGGVSFHGRVSADRKHELMERAHVHLFTSHREGWGLVVSEAAAMGTPSVGYDVPGVRDSIAEPDLLAPRGDRAGLATRALDLVSSGDRYEAVRRRAWERARAMSAEATTAAFAELLWIPGDQVSSVRGG